MGDRNQNPPPFVPVAPPLPVNEPPLIDTRVKATPRVKHKSTSRKMSWVMLAMVTAVILLSTLYAYWPAVVVKLRARNAEQRLVLSWIMENEGDPSSVKLISVEGPVKIKWTSLVRVKYRATSPLGGPVMYDHCYSVDAATKKVKYSSDYIHFWPGSDEQRVQQDVKKSIRDVLKGKLRKDPNLINRRPNERPGGRM